MLSRALSSRPALLRVQTSTVRSSSPAVRPSSGTRWAHVGEASGCESMRPATLVTAVTQLADRVLVPLLDLERLARQAWTAAVAAVIFRFLGLCLGFGRRGLAQPGQRRLHVGRAEDAPRGLPLFLVQ